MPPRPFEGTIALEGQLTGDGRLIDSNALTWGEGPWPVKFHRVKGDHGGPVVGDLLRVWRDGGNIRGSGVLHTESADPQTLADVNRLIELLESGSVGVSIRLDDEVVELRMKKEAYDEMVAEWEAWMNDEVPEPDDPETDADGRIVLERYAVDDLVEAVTSGRLRELSVVDVAAFIDAGVDVSEETADEDSPIAASIRLLDTLGLAASLSIDDRARSFANPNFGPNGDVDPRLIWQEPTRVEEGAGGWGCPLTFEDDGSFYGHATLKFRCHGSMQACWTDRGGDLSQWLIGDATGLGIPTGVMTFDTTHGVDDRSQIISREWLHNTGLGWGDAAAGYDQHGLWVAGRVRPGLTERERVALRGSTLSGEWHPNGAGRLRLVGILSVNAPGLLVQRVSQKHGIAAAFTVGAQCCTGEVKTIDDRLESIEKAVAYMLREKE